MMTLSEKMIRLEATGYSGGFFWKTLPDMRVMKHVFARVWSMVCGFHYSGVFI